MEFNPADVPNYIAMAVPVFFLMIGVELILSRIVGKDFYRFNDSVNDLSMGVYDQVLGAFLKAAIFAVYLAVYDHFALADLHTASVWTWLLAFIGVDFCYYWAHRAGHEINVIWGSHIPHHQSEEFNLSVALRQGAFEGSFFFVFYLPLAVLGIPPLAFLVAGQLVTLYQFWIHTRGIGKLGPLEWVMNTPSHHRVHHGCNPKYIDKNYGAMFIVWDRLFGTFQVEEEEPDYGIVTPLASWNPLWGQVHHFVALAKKARTMPTWGDAVRVWFTNPAWMPDSMGGPIPRDADEARPPKYNPDTPFWLNIYILVHFVPMVLLGTRFLTQYAELAWVQRIGIAFMVLWALVCMGGIFETKRWAFWIELTRLAVLVVTIVGWGLDAYGFEHYNEAVFVGPVLFFLGISMFWVLAHRKYFITPMRRMAVTAPVVD